jgi:secreted Zn-dependent insulinase-like peptidase
MTIAIYSNSSLETLEKLVADAFGVIPNKNLPAVTYKGAIQRFPLKNKRKTIFLNTAPGVRKL